MVKKNLAERGDELPTPKYVVLNEELFDTGAIWHVKFSKPILVRLLEDNGSHQPSFAEAEYGLVVSSSWVGKDDNGSFVYEETTVTAADEDGNDERARIYHVGRRLELFEIMFNIGEI